MILSNVKVHINLTHYFPMCIDICSFSLVSLNKYINIARVLHPINCYTSSRLQKINIES